jgi:hypothetical protein
MFVTALDGWRAGNEFTASAELQRFRILAIEPEMGEDAPLHAVWIVEPVT